MLKDKIRLKRSCKTNLFSYIHEGKEFVPNDQSYVGFRVNSIFLEI